MSRRFKDLKPSDAGQATSEVSNQNYLGVLGANDRMQVWCRVMHWFAFFMHCYLGPVV